MTDSTPSSTSPSFVSKTPFDWLQSGLFFGGGGGGNSNKSSSNNNNNNNNNDNNNNTQSTAVSSSVSSLEAIDSCVDVFILLNGISENLNEITATATVAAAYSHQQQQQQQQLLTSMEEAAVDSTGRQSTTSTSTSTSTSESASASAPPNEEEYVVAEAASKNSCEASKFIAARLARLRYLLYDERRITSSQQQQQQHHHLVQLQQQQQQQSNSSTSSSSSSIWRLGGGGGGGGNSVTTKTLPAVIVAGNTIQALTGKLSTGSSGTIAATVHNTCLGDDTTCCNISNDLTELVPKLLSSMVLLPFESRKHVAAIFNYLLVCGLDGYDRELYQIPMSLFVQYIYEHFIPIMTIITNGHYFNSNSTTNNQLLEQEQEQEQSEMTEAEETILAATTKTSMTTATTITTDIGLHFGSMYRSILRHPILYKELVGTTTNVTRFVYPFLDTYVHVPNFEISSDAMETVRYIFNAGTNNTNSTSTTGNTTTTNNNTSNPNNNNNDNSNSTNPNTTNATCWTSDDDERVRQMGQIAADFLVRDYVGIWDERYNPKLLDVDIGQANYMTRRVALQILSTVLLTRSNYNIMIRYVASRTNLIVVMKLLRDTSPHITLDAFHVFKVFVANPNKSAEVCKILKDNQIKLCKYLQTLHQDREDHDIQFRDEKALIISTIQEL